MKLRIFFIIATMIAMCAIGLFFEFRIVNLSSFIMLMIIASCAMLMICVSGAISEIGRQQHAVTLQIPSEAPVCEARPVKRITETETTVEPGEIACLGRSSDKVVIIINPPLSLTES